MDIVLFLLKALFWNYTCRYTQQPVQLYSRVWCISWIGENITNWSVSFLRHHTWWCFERYSFYQSLISMVWKLSSLEEILIYKTWWAHDTRKHTVNNTLYIKILLSHSMQLLHAIPLSPMCPIPFNAIIMTYLHIWITYKLQSNCSNSQDPNKAYYCIQYAPGNKSL